MISHRIVCMCCASLHHFIVVWLSAVCVCDDVEGCMKCVCVNRGEIERGNKELNAINPCNADALLYQCSTGWITLSSVSLCAYHISVCIQSRLYRCSPVSSVCTVNGKQVGVYSTRWNQHEMIVDTLQTSTTRVVEMPSMIKCIALHDQSITFPDAYMQASMYRCDQQT